MVYKNTIKKQDDFFWLSITNILIFFSFIGMLLFQFWFLNFFYQFNGTLFHYLEMFVRMTMHADMAHFLGNALFMFYYWNKTEYEVWKIRYFFFFVFCVIFTFSILHFLNSSVVWISCFTSAISFFYALHLRWKWNPEWKLMLGLWLFSIWYGLMPWVSFYWHLFGWLSWVVFYYLSKTGKN